MKKMSLLLLSVFLLGSLSVPAYADHRSRHRSHFGLYIGPSWAYSTPYYYQPYQHYQPYQPYQAYPLYPPYQPAPVIIQSAPPVYIEQTPAAPVATSPQASNDWYFCASTKTYYPYVKECAEPWQRVSPTPANPDSVR